MSTVKPLITARAVCELGFFLGGGGVLGKLYPGLLFEETFISGASRLN